MKKIFSLFVVALFALSAMAKQYCQETLENGSNSIQLTCVEVSSGNYRITIEGTNLNGLGGSFFNPGTVELRNTITSSSATQIVCDITAASAPSLYTPLYVLMPGEVSFAWPSDIEWGQCIARPTMMLRGTLSDWDPGVTMTDNGSSASVAMNLAASTTYEFKIYNSTANTWHGNSGTMTRENCSNWVFNVDANAKITTDIAGEYVFTWKYDENKLSVKYPSLDSPYCETEIGHMAANNADANSFVLLSVGSDGAGHTIVNIKQDAAKNSVMFDYLQVSGQASSGMDVTNGGWNEMSCTFNTPTPDANGEITLEILWSTVGWAGRWMVQNLKVKADSVFCSNCGYWQSYLYYRRRSNRRLGQFPALPICGYYY